MPSNSPTGRALPRSRNDYVRLPREELRSRETNWSTGHHQTILDLTVRNAAGASEDQGVGVEDISVRHVGAEIDDQ